MFQSPIVAVFLATMVVAVAGDSSSDVEKAMSILTQKNISDFLKAVEAAYPAILSLTEAQIKTVTENATMTPQEKEKIAKFQDQLQKIDPTFSHLLKAVESLPPHTNPQMDTLRPLKSMETIRTQIVEKKSKAIEFVRKYEDLEISGISESIKNGFLFKDIPWTIIPKFQAVSQNAPKEMDAVVEGLIKTLIRFNVLELTNSLLKKENQDFINGKMNYLRQRMNRTIESARDLMVMIHLKNDVDQLLIGKSIKYICDVAMEMTSYLHKKYPGFEFAVLVYDNSKRAVAKICRGVYGSEDNELSAIVAMRDVKAKPRDVKVWIDRYLDRKTYITRTRRKLYIEMSEMIFGTLGDRICSKSNVLAMIDMSNPSCLKTSPGINHHMRTKHIKRCYDPACWSKDERNYMIYVID